jgi:hypothetical protein
MTRQPVYTGKHDPTIERAANKFKFLDRFSEQEMLEWAMEYSDDLRGLWVNNTVLLRRFRAEDVAVVTAGGAIKRLPEHPNYRKWADEMSADELYSLFGTNW